MKLLVFAPVLLALAHAAPVAQPASESTAFITAQPGLT
jgi:hypothetical protein